MPIKAADDHEPDLLELEQLREGHAGDLEQRASEDLLPRMRRVAGGSLLAAVAPQRDRKRRVATRAPGWNSPASQRAKNRAWRS